MEEVDRIQSEIDCLKAERDATLAELQGECGHPLAEVREVDYQKSSYGSCIRPYRVCLRCGYAEEGWGSGYWRLHRNVHKIQYIDREESRKYIRTFLSQSKMSQIRYGR